MEFTERLRRDYALAVLQQDCIQTELALHTYVQAWRRRRQCNMRYWVKSWIQRHQEFCLYDQLMAEQAIDLCWFCQAVTETGT